MKDIVIKYGLIGGVISLLSSALVYFIGLGISSGLISLLFFAVYIIIGVRAVKDFRKGNEGKISFLEGFLTSFISFLIIFLIANIFSYVLFNQIDKGWIDTQKTKMTEKIESIEAMPEEAKAKQLEKIDQMDDAFSPKKLLLGYAKGAGFFAVISLIIGLAIKKDINEITPQT